MDHLAFKEIIVALRAGLNRSPGHIYHTLLCFTGVKMEVVLLTTTQKCDRSA